MESTLTYPKTDLESKLGRWAGFGGGPNGVPTSTWDTTQTAMVTDCVKSGIARVYHCGYEWSWLQMMGQVTLATGLQTASMPDDFGAMLDPVSIYSTSSGSGFAIRNAGIGSVNLAYAREPNLKGTPKIYAEVNVSAPTGIQGTRKKLVFFPIADQNYTIQFPYSVLPNALTSDEPYVYGGSQCSELFLASCKACWEKDYDDSSYVQRDDFEELLQMQIKADNRNKPRNFGCNSDDSDEDRRWGWQRGGGSVTNLLYNGAPI